MIKNPTTIKISKVVHKCTIRQFKRIFSTKIIIIHTPSFTSFIAYEITISQFNRKFSTKIIIIYTPSFTSFIAYEITISQFNRKFSIKIIIIHTPSIKISKVVLKCTIPDRHVGAASQPRSNIHPSTTRIIRRRSICIPPGDGKAIHYRNRAYILRPYHMIAIPCGHIIPVYIPAEYGFI